MKRTVKSPLGLYLVPQVQKFLVDNAKENESGATLEIGMDDLANAIEYAVSLALSSPMMQTAFSAGIVPPPVSPSPQTVGAPVGTLIYNVLKPLCTEQ